jgi:hypothetical protein
MIVIDKGSTQSNIVVTLNEKLSVEEPYIELLLENVENHLIFTYSITEDLSLFPNRYNKYDLDLSELEVGIYDYYFYENNENILEVGILKVVDDIINDEFYENDDDVQTYYG